MKKIILATLAIALVVVAVFLMLRKEPIPIITDNTDVEVINMVTQVDFLVPVSSFSRLRNNISLSDLTNSELCAFDDDKEIVSELFASKEVTLIDEEQIDEYLKNDFICLLSPADVDFRYKSLAIDDQLYWDKETKLADYPLKWTYEIDEKLVDYDKANEAKKYEMPENRAQIFAGGEIIPARAVDRLALNKNNNYTYLYDFFKEDIADADLAIALLENPLNGNPTPCTGCMAFVGDEQNALGLKTVGFDILSLAGNHAGDGGQSGFKRTLELLNENDIQSTGAANNDTDKIKPAIQEINGKKFAVISADTVAGYYWNKASSYYGTNWFSKKMNSEVDYDRVAMIKELKKENEIDYLIVYMSWGVEYTNRANTFQTELAHALIDNGADVIIASHPHWVQNIEVYKDKPIFYSLGNFIFDQNHTDATREGIAINLYYVDTELKSIEVMPHLSCGPFVSNVNLTDKYLAGEIDASYIYENDEARGCVYFQPKKLLDTDKYYRSTWERMMQFTTTLN